MTSYVSSVLETPQTEADPLTNQVRNSAGGFSFELDPFKRLERFLILGCEGGTYYASQKKLTVENAKCVFECMKRDIPTTVVTIVEFSERAPKNDACIFALALVAAFGAKTSGYNPTKLNNELCYAVNRVCRTGTHLFQFVEAINSLRGWGRGLKRIVSSWYENKSSDALAYQMVKYRQRNGFTHLDVLRLCHHSCNSDLYRWVTESGYSNRSVVRRDNGDISYYPAPFSGLPYLIKGFEAVKIATSGKEVAALVKEYSLPRECVPDVWLNDIEVWRALLPHMPMTAMVRNLGKMTSIGLLAPLSEAANLVQKKLEGELGRLHPLTVLQAYMTYKFGRGIKGSLSWQPVPNIISSLASAFQQSFSSVEPTNKRWLFGLDVSGSMRSPVSGMTGVTCHDAAVALALVSIKNEPYTHCTGFCDKLIQLPFNKETSFSQAVEFVSRLDFGSTDCALPMLYALERRIPVDVFCVITDNETYHGSIHPHQALAKYRKEMGIQAKLIVMAMTSTGFTIADPNDPNQLDVVGFDTETPAIMAHFANS